ncbi:hypothetical protein ALP97_05247 [Pseudomonas salomonii]|uniref:Uncharacterized protein n=1 Tax=Pseudomonas salomonii TaxID=191391 RepID=A0A3M4PUE2_9PSED|nr:hypothetical protein ALP97_05247 [Pseudomonas salomonii]
MSDVDEQAAQTRQHGVSVFPHASILGIDHHRFKERIHRLTQGGQARQCFGVVAFGKQRLHGVFRFGDGRVQRELLGIGKQARVDFDIAEVVSLAQQVRHTLVHGGQGIGLRQLAEGLYGLYALVEVQCRTRLQGTYRQVDGNVHAFVFVTRTQAVEYKFQHLLGQAGLLDLGAKLADCKHHGLGQVEVELFVDQDTQHAQGRTAQGIRVFAAGRQHADTEDTDEGVQLVSDGHGRTGQGAWQLSASTARHVLLVQCQGYIVRLAVVEGVVVTGDALHLWELADHFGGQVALGQQASAGCPGSVTANAWGNVGGQLGNAHGLVVDAAEFFLEHHVLQAQVEVFELLLLVLFEEEFGVSQARAYDFLVTGDDLLRVFAFDVGHGDKTRQQLTVHIQQAEILLVVLHGGDQGFLRHVEETLFERAHQRHRPFNQRGHFVEQAWRHDGSAFLQAGQLFGALADQLATLVGIGQHVSATQVGGVVGRRGDAHGFWMVEAVTTGITASLLGEDRAVDDLVTEQHHQPLSWAHELFLARTPAHALGDRQVVQGVFNDGRQQARRWLAGNDLAETQFRAALVDLAQLNATLLGKTKGGLSRIAFSIKRRLTRWAVEVDAAVRLLGFQRGQQHRQATWRGVDFFRSEFQAGAVQAFFDTGQERIGQGVECLGWQLFGAQFNQEILSTHCAASSLANTSSRRSGVAIGKPSLARANR